MAKAPGDVSNWDGSGQVWFKVHEISAVTNGGQSITFPAENIQQFTFTIPRSLPSGQYLIRTEQIALHSASGYQGAQFYASIVSIKILYVK